MPASASLPFMFACADRMHVLGSSWLSGRLELFRPRSTEVICQKLLQLAAVAMQLLDLPWIHAASVESRGWKKFWWHRSSRRPFLMSSVVLAESRRPWRRKTITNLDQVQIWVLNRSLSAWQPAPSSRPLEGSRLSATLQL